MFDNRTSIGLPCLVKAIRQNLILGSSRTANALQLTLSLKLVSETPAPAIDTGAMMFVGGFGVQGSRSVGIQARTLLVILTSVRQLLMRDLLAENRNRVQGAFFTPTLGRRGTGLITHARELELELSLSCFIHAECFKNRKTHFKMGGRSDTTSGSHRLASQE
jgi:hypothetical protein